MFKSLVTAASPSLSWKLYFSSLMNIEFLFLSSTNGSISCTLLYFAFFFLSSYLRDCSVLVHHKFPPFYRCIICCVNNLFNQFFMDTWIISSLLLIMPQWIILVHFMGANIYLLDKSLCVKLLGPRVYAL